MKIFVLFLLFALISPGAAFDLSPKNPGPGEDVTIRGSASPGEEVRLRSSFEMDLPVENGKFEYVSKGVNVPQKPNKLSVVAENVDELNVGVKMGIWVTMPVSVSRGVASVSKSDVPPGSYTLKMFGKALQSSDPVSIRVDAETTVRTDSDGEYEFVMDTSGVPEGEYKIRVAGEEEIIVIGRSLNEEVSGRSRSEQSSSGAGVSTRKPSDLGSTSDRKKDQDLALVIPDPYYRDIKKADAENPDDIIRYVSSVRTRAIDLDVFERAAFYENYLKGCGFNVSFAYSENFDNRSQDHLWLLVTTRKGEVIEVDPSYKVAGGSSILPLDSEYLRYDQTFADIYGAADFLGVERLAWWTDETAWGSSLTEAPSSDESALNVSSEPIEERGFISRIRDLLMRVFGKIGSTV